MLFYEIGRIFRTIFFDFSEISKNRPKNKKKKWGLEMINNSPFETGISRICGGDMGKNSVQIQVSNGQLLMVSRPHFIFDFSSDFLRFRRNREKLLEKSPDNFDNSDNNFDTIKIIGSIIKIGPP